MNKVLVVTTEPLPLPGGLTTGAGLRAWGLAEGLRAFGFPVIIATPLEGEQAVVRSKADTTDPRVRFFHRNELNRLIERENPDVIVMQHWGLVYALPELRCPLVIDLAGPHLLERRYWGNPDPDRDLQEKLTALKRADFVTCGGEFQRHYFYPYLSMAGFDVRTDQFPVIPFSVSPEEVKGAPAIDSETTFIYGGAFLAWQNPQRPIRWLLDEMDSAGKGRLLFYGGSHPSMDASGGRFIELYQYLKTHPRVEIRGWKPFDELRNEYAAKGHVALDLMERNPERELAYTTRTMIYLQCGLPVIYNNYSEISALIQKSNCGWCLDPEDETGFRELARLLLREPGVALKMRANARKAAAEQNWNDTIKPLAEFCDNPKFRDKGHAAGITVEKPLHTGLETRNVEYERGFTKLNGVRRNFLPNPGKYAGIVVYFPVWLISKYLYYRLKVSSSSRAHYK